MNLSPQSSTLRSTSEERVQELEKQISAKKTQSLGDPKSFSSSGCTHCGKQPMIDLNGDVTVQYIHLFLHSIQ